jgi:hypothetical protein
MAQLPQIEYGAPVEQVGNAALPAVALRQVGNVIEEGMTLYAKEQIKTEMMQADATVQKQLNDATLEIQARPSIPAGELRTILGDQVPDHVARAMTVQKLDPSTGQMVEVDNEQVPMFLVAGAIYDRRAKEAVQAGMSQITLGGWKADFQDRSAQHVEQRRMTLAEVQLRAMHQYQGAEQKDAIAKLRNAGAYDLADKATRESLILEGKDKVEELAKNLEARQAAPVYLAMDTGDPTLLKAEIVRLTAGGSSVNVPGGRPIDRNRPVIQNEDGSISTERTTTVEVDGRHLVIPTIVDGKARTQDEAIQLWKDGKNQEVGDFASAKEAEKYAVDRSKAIGIVRQSEGIDGIPQPHREALVHQMKAQLRAIDAQAEAAEEKRQKRVTSYAYNQLAQIEIAARSTGVTPPPELVFGIVRRYAKPGTVKGEDLKALTAYAESITKGEERKTDLDLYQQLELAAAEDPEAFKNDKISLFNRATGEVKEVGLLQVRGALSDGDFKKFAGIQGTLSKDGRESSMYQDFLGVTGYMKSKLEADYGFDVQKPSDDQRKQMAAVSIAVNTELSTAARLKGTKLNTVERDKVIDQTLARSIQVNKGFFSTSTELKTAGVDPDLAVALSSLSNRRLKTPDIIEEAKNFGYYAPAIEAAWVELSPRVPLTTERAVQVYNVLSTRWRDIDAKLLSSGVMDPEKIIYEKERGGTKQKEALNAQRAAMAVKWYLKGVR